MFLSYVMKKVILLALFATLFFAGCATGPKIDWDSRKIDVARKGDSSTVRYRDRLEDDLIWEDGAFVQLPVQAKPKAKD